MTQFVLQIGRAAEGLDELFSQQFSVPPSQARNIRFDRAFGDPKPRCDLGISGGRSFSRKKLFQHFESAGPTGCPEFVAQAGASLFQKRETPSAVIDLVRTQAIRRFERISVLRSQFIQRNRAAAASSFLRSSAVPL